MVLDLTRELDEWRTYGSPREARADLRRALRRGPLAGAALLPDPDRREGHDGAGVQADAQRWQMPFASSRGYSSLKLQHDVARC